ncbi:MAG: 1-deoxy-D-xylulose-5-phosphate synthase [Oscillospiraceae bacterium]|nr:1-deoxy-D-xylulose-5-phosphate synthase [Oscillospiraceae bacterium]
MKRLDRIHASADVKELAADVLPELCAELREEILENVSHSGGHLASSLGAVELTVALHRVYDTARDRLVFDVGHQCYAHKLLTGRREQFATLRQLGGLSGFPKPCESVDDAAIAGHASTSVSVALGMARARTLQGEDYAVAAVIGDGALTGGAAYEGLCDCGASAEPILVVLNDNAMSISENVGGMSHLLALLRVRPGYLRFKRFYRRTVGRYGSVYKVLHRIKEWVKDLLLGDNMFEDMGFYYLGPVDGHDLPTLIRTISYARGLNCPVLLHVRTVKGKGYAPAEEKPALYHGVGPFDLESGVSGAEKTSFSSVFGQELCKLAEEDPRIVAITAAMTDGTGLARFAEAFPTRFFDVGIAEGHAVAMAAGLAARGMRPVFAVYSSFLQRAYDMLIHDVSLSGQRVVLGVDRAGLVGADGETHQGAFDVNYLCSVPGLRLWAPSSYAELRSMLRKALDADGPAALRYPRGGEGKFQEDTSDRDALLLRPGKDLTIVSYGITVNDALAAAEGLSVRGYSLAVVKLNRLDAPDFEPAVQSLKKTKRLIVVEDAARAGGLGTRLLAELEGRGLKLQGFRLLDLGDGVVPQGEVSGLRKMLGQDAEGIAQCALELINL